MSRRLQSRRGFTLVELLVVIAILGILMSMILFALQGAAESARLDRTKAQVAKINDLIMQRWDGYRQRPMPVRMNFNPNAPTAAQSISISKQAAIWELMRMELPERISDLSNPAVYLKAANGTPMEPALWRAYRRKAEALTQSTWGGGVEAKWTGEYSNAECLYLILSTIKDSDTNGLDFFTSQEIGDTDGDGMPEILDGWKRPIRFLRWAPGYSSNLPPTGPQGITLAAPSAIQSGDAVNQHDPFDPYKSYSTHFALVPLIYSAGPDGLYGVAGDNASTPVVYSSKNPPNDPYATVGTSPVMGACIQENGKDTYIDNITNHLNVTTR